MYKKSMKKFFVLGVAAVSLSILATVGSPSHAASTTVTLGVKKSRKQQSYGAGQLHQYLY
ncbi:hypothetical protein [uncultured Brevibacillus sp.]|uniref:hypothetical protein n=1 Tax=uncultured Brevibacillus sp. TaxID=169970 RepID=UPI0025937015|nr:hypothetical protein [uncultured Brevibacillus sp.]